MRLEFERVCMNRVWYTSEFKDSPTSDLVPESEHRRHDLAPRRRGRHDLVPESERRRRARRCPRKRACTLDLRDPTHIGALICLSTRSGTNSPPTHARVVIPASRARRRPEASSELSLLSAGSQRTEAFLMLICQLSSCERQDLVGIPSR